MLDGLGRTGRRLLFWMQRDRLERELAEELELHIRLQQADTTEENCYREMGNLTLAKEESRDQWGFVWIEHWLQDIRYALRTFRKNPGVCRSAVTRDRRVIRDCSRVEREERSTWWKR